MPNTVYTRDFSEIISMTTDAYKMSFRQCHHRCSHSHREQQRPQPHHGGSLNSHILLPLCWTSDVFTSHRLGSYGLSSCLTYTCSGKVYANSLSGVESSILYRIYVVCCADLISICSWKLHFSYFNSPFACYTKCWFLITIQQSRSSHLFIQF